MANKIQIRRGYQIDLPSLDEGEMGFATDTERLYIGNPLGSGNILMSIGGPGFDLGNGADGYVTFFTGPNALAGDNDFFWDRENNRLGLRTDQPTHTLTVDGYITPATDNFHRLGTPDQRWEAIHLGPDSLHISSTAIETGTSFDWRITIDQTTGNEGKLLIVQGEEQFVSVDPVTSEIIFTVEEVTAEGNIKLAQINAPINESGYGKLYVSSADSKLHFIDESGSDTNILSDFASQTIEDQRWIDSSEQRQDIRDALDGYGSDSNDLDNQRWVDSSQQRQDLRDACDGYASSTNEDQRWIDSSEQRQDIRDTLDGYALASIEDQRWVDSSRQFQDIRNDLDGYAPLSIENQRWVDSSEQRQNIRNALDGYGVGSGNVVATEGADGYISFFTGEQTIAGDNDLFWHRANNRLGVGTSSPTEKVDINGGIRIGASTGDNNAGTIRWDGSNFQGNDGSGWVNLDSSGGSASGASGAVQFSNGAGGFSSDDTNLHWDDGNDRLGIGTNSPSKQFHVQNSSDAFALVESTGSGDVSGTVRVQNDAGKVFGINQMGSGFSGSYGSIERAGASVLWTNGECMIIHTQNAVPIHFNTGNATAMTISVDQHLGIGTTLPIEKLTVNGVIALQEQPDSAATEDGYGKLYIKSDEKLYYKDGSGNETDLTAGGSASGDGYGAPAYDIISVQTGGYIASFDEVVRCDPSGGGFTVTLPAASVAAGRTVIVKNTTSSINTITIDGDGAETIDGQASVTITEGYKSLTFVSYGSEWGII